MTDSGAERAARRAIQFLRDIDWSASSNEWKYERVAAIIREETGTQCEHCKAGDAPIGHVYHLLETGQRENCSRCPCSDCAAAAPDEGGKR